MEKKKKREKQIDSKINACGSLASPDVRAAEFSSKDLMLYWHSAGDAVCTPIGGWNNGTANSKGESTVRELRGWG